MRVERPAGSITQVIARLQDLEAWDQWVPGLESSDVEHGAVRLRFGGPRPFHLTLEVTALDDGARWAMREGDLQGCRGEARVVSDRLRIVIEVDFPVVLPGSLWTSLESQWLVAVAKAATD